MRRPKCVGGARALRATVSPSGWNAESLGPSRSHVLWHARAVAWGETALTARRRHRSVPRLVLNQQEAAEALGVSVTHFEGHIKHDLEVIYSGSLRLYPVAGLNQWIREHTLRTGRRIA